MNKTTVYAVALTALLSAIVYFGEAPERILGTSDALTSEVNQIPFSVARNATTTHYAEDGSLSYTFDADRLEHYRDELGEDTSKVFTLLENPTLVFYEKEQPWRVRAQKGKISANNEQIELWDDVVLVHINADGVTTEVTTNRLYMDPINKLAKTQEPVKIVSDKIQIQGTGMRANLVSKKLNLLSDVRGLYDPT